jgi:hypothetical protein
MADDTNTKADATAPAEAAAAVVETVASMNDAAVSTAKASRKGAGARTSKARRSATKPRTARTAQPKAAAAAVNERNSTMNFDTNRWFASFNAFPTATPFQTLFADAGERGHDAVAKSQ